MTLMWFLCEYVCFEREGTQNIHARLKVSQQHVLMSFKNIVRSFVVEIDNDGDDGSFEGFFLLEGVDF